MVRVAKALPRGNPFRQHRVMRFRIHIGAPNGGTSVLNREAVQLALKEQVTGKKKRCQGTGVSEDLRPET